MSPQKHVEEEIPELPPLDDDGSLFEDDEELVIDEDRASDLDDATAEDEPLDRFSAFEGIADEGSMLDAAEESSDLDIDEERELLAGAEIGLLEDSDEGDGRDMTADEAGLFDEDSGDDDDGGAEGTGEDPSSTIEELPDQRAGDAVDDEGIDDDSRFEDASAARVREGLEGEPWPARADASWNIARAPERLSFEGESITSHGDLVAATRDGALIVSIDGGENFVRVPSCTGVTAAAIIREPRAVLAALHDSTREASAIVLVRVGETISAEVVADFMADDSDEDVRVSELAVRPKGQGVEVLVRGAFGALLLTSRARG